MYVHPCLAHSILSNLLVHPPSFEPVLTRLHYVFVFQTQRGVRCVHPEWWVGALRQLYPNASDVDYVGHIDA
jgi:hypothetical protein